MRFVRHARGLGFSVEVCSQLLSLYEDKGRKSAAVKALAQDHLNEVDNKIKELQELRSTISHLMKNCQGDNRPDCPILEGIATGA